MLGQRFIIYHPDTDEPCNGIVEEIQDNMVVVMLAPGKRLWNGSISHGMERWEMRREIVEACVNAQKY